MAAHAAFRHQRILGRPWWTERGRPCPLAQQRCPHRQRDVRRRLGSLRLGSGRTFPLFWYAHVDVRICVRHESPMHSVMVYFLLCISFSRTGSLYLLLLVFGFRVPGLLSRRGLNTAIKYSWHACSFDMAVFIGLTLFAPLFDSAQVSIRPRDILATDNHPIRHGNGLQRSILARITCPFWWNRLVANRSSSYTSTWLQLATRTSKATCSQSMQSKHAVKACMAIAIVALCLARAQAAAPGSGIRGLRQCSGENRTGRIFCI